MYLSHHIPLYSFISHYRGISIHWCTQIAGWFIIEKTIKLDDLGVSPFQEYIYILIITYIHTILSHYITHYIPLSSLILSHSIPMLHASHVAPRQAPCCRCWVWGFALWRPRIVKSTSCRGIRGGRSQGRIISKKNHKSDPPHQSGYHIKPSSYLGYPHFRKHPYRIVRLAATHDFRDSPEGWKDLSGAILVFWDVADEIYIIWHISGIFSGRFCTKVVYQSSFPMCFFAITCK